MSKEYSQLNAKYITQYCQQHFMPGADVASIQWVITHWSTQETALSHSRPNGRSLEISDLRDIRKIINRVPSGKRRHYHQALQCIIYYLGDALHWTLPTETTSTFIDKELHFYEHLSSNAHQAWALNTVYECYKNTFLKERTDISSAFAALVIAMEVAPLSIPHLYMLLNDKDCIEQNGTTLYLNIKHVEERQQQNEQIRFTRYHLPFFVYRLLTEYQRRLIHVTEHGLATQLIQFLNEKPFSLSSLSARNWHIVLQSLWANRNAVVPSLLQDISYPERHVAFIKLTVPLTEKAKKLKLIYEQDWDDKWFGSLTPASKLSRFPHKKLIKNRQLAQAAKAPPWSQDDVLPTMLFYYTQEFVLHGGPVKKVLATSSIYKYSNIESLFNEQPLPYAHAIDKELLHAWAHRVYDSLNNQTNMEGFYRFLRFMCCHWLTEQLDLSEFSAPTTLPLVDPFYISIRELKDIVEALLTQPQGHLFQRLSCAVTCILAYFAMFRRGEIIRLRVRDIYPNSGQKQCFYIVIKNTAEGKTKSGKSRTIHITIPEEFALLVRVLLLYKKSCSPNAPLIGYVGEKYHERQLYYLLPVTKALKAITGQQTRFHHLRHSGIYLFFLQGLHLAYELDPAHTTHDIDIHALLTPDAVSQRFDYWLEGNPFSRCNDNLLFDEIGRQIGHEYYATTRWSYLHGIEWLYPFYCKGYGELQQRTFTHPELRYLLGLNPTSNDLSRQLKVISPEYANKTLSQRQNDPINLTEHTLKSLIFNTKTVTPSSPLPLSMHYVNAWLGNIDRTQTLHFLKQIMLDMRQTNEIDFSLFSYLWLHSGKHLYHALTNTQVSALSRLPLIVRDEDHKGSLKLVLACNVKNAQLINIVFRTEQWQWLDLSFELTVNRKTNKSRQISLLNKYFAKDRESIKCIIQPIGNSQLTILLTPKHDPKDWLAERLLCFLNDVQQQKRGKND
jgi:integrase